MAERGGGAWGRPVVPSAGRLRPLGLGEVRLEPGFWGDRERLAGEVIVNHCRDWMTRLGWIGNFRAAASGGASAGREFADSEAYKLLEAFAWEAGNTGRDEAERAVAELTEEVAAAQEPDGYLNTRFGWRGPEARYRDLEWGHELYCYGHLIQAAVARLRTAGEDPLVAVARRAADHVCKEFGPAGRDAICGHPEIEPALAELYRATGDDRYLEQARLFVERRGHGLLRAGSLGPAYNQDDLPVRQARVLRGHAVRALYLACGAVDVAVETGDDELLEAVAEQWRNTVAARTYITGGMGSRHSGESFGEDFELPPDRAYAETCAGVASVMLSWRLLLATGEARYADAIERTLYNVVAASPALDGHSFFYSNPLQQRFPATVLADDAENPNPARGLRSRWFAVSCCPNNVARTLTSLAAYVASADDHGVQLHQLTACSVRATLPDGRPVGLRVATDYPWTGAVTVRVEESGGGPWRVALRVPSWAEGAVLVHDGQRRPVGPAGLSVGGAARQAGYVVVEAPWRPGDEVRLELPMRPRWTRPDPRIDAVRGCVAAERGPLVYCAESVRQDPSLRLDALAVDTSAPPADKGRDEGLGGAVWLRSSARPLRLPESGWPYAPDQDGVAPEAAPLALIPYHMWANRGPSTMRVWLPELPWHAPPR
ncbi:MAG TPA: beta-L-arabinofuranosidase domain-containing protein [Actinomycetes bacterium]